MVGLTAGVASARYEQMACHGTLMGIDNILNSTNHQTSAEEARADICWPEIGVCLLIRAKCYPSGVADSSYRIILKVGGYGVNSRPSRS